MAQILLDLSEIRQQFPNGQHQVIEDDIAAEVELIETELAARKRGVRQSANPKLADFEYTHVFDDVDSYEQLNAEYDESSEWGYE